MGAGLVKIAGVETEFFLTIDDSGTLRATVSAYKRLFVGLNCLQAQVPNNAAPGSPRKTIINSQKIPNLIL